MKNTGILALLIIISFVCPAQSGIGIFAGTQTNTAKYSISGEKQPNEYKRGLHAGVSLKIPFDKGIFFSPAVFYSLKGYKVKFTSYAYPPDTAAIDNNTSIHTVELAVLLQIEIGQKPDHFFFKAGPSLDVQLSGNEKFRVKTGGTVDRKMTFSFGEYGNFGGNLLMQFGFESGKGFTIFCQYTHGLGSINNADGGPQIHHRVYGVSIGQYFNRRKTVIDTRNKE